MVAPSASDFADKESDAHLLASFRHQGSEQAFGELVRRHVGFVYAAAFRIVRDPQLAEDVVQAVFLALARNAGRLVDHPALCGWLHITTRNLASNWVRREFRRQRLEKETASMHLSHSTSDSAPNGHNSHWQAAETQLDAAIGDLTTQDQHTLLLRYFQGKSARETACQLGISEEAAQKRASRALERLRQALNRRGIPVGASALLVGLASQPLQAAPAGLAARVAGSTAKLLLADPTLVSSVSHHLLKMTTYQKLTASAICAVLLGASVSHAVKVINDRQELASVRQSRNDVLREMESLQDTLSELRDRNGRLLLASLEVDSLRDELARSRRSRATSNSSVRQALDPVAEQELEAMVQRMVRLKEWARTNSSHVLPEFQLLSAGDWLSAIKDRPMDSAVDFRRAMSFVREVAQRKFGLRINDALRAFQKGTGRAMPTELSELLPYFSSPPDPAMLNGWTLIPATSLPSLWFEGEVAITQKAAIDEVLDVRFGIGQNGFGSADFSALDTGTELQRLNQAYMDDHNGEWPPDISGLLDYAKTPREIELVNRFIERQQAGR